MPVNYKTFRSVACYARVSTAGQVERDLSVPDQLDSMRKFCSEQGWTIAATFVDEGISGGKQAARAQFSQMLEKALKRPAPFDLILTRDQARFGRGDADNWNRAQLRRNGVRVDNLESPVGDMTVDGITVAGRKAERQDSIEDISFRERIAPKVIASQRRGVELGRFTGSSGTMFGYLSDYGGGGPHAVRKTVLHPTNAPIVREMFDRAARGDSIRSIVGWLNASNVPGPRNGDGWYARSVKNILKNETATGALIYGRLRSIENVETEKMKYVPGVREPVRYENAFPALVPRELFDEVQRKLADPQRLKSVPRGGPQMHNLLQGIGRCAACDSSLGAQQRFGHWYLMCNSKRANGSNADARCSGALPTAYVDEVVLHFLDRYVGYKGFEKTMRAAIAAYNAAAKEYRGLTEVERLDTRIRDLVVLVGKMVQKVERTESPALERRLLELESELKAAQTQREALASVTDAVVPLDADKLVSTATALKKARRTNDRLAIKRFLTELFTVQVDYTKRANRDVRAFSFTQLSDLEPSMPASDILFSGAETAAIMSGKTMRVLPDGSTEFVEPTPSSIPTGKAGTIITAPGPLRFVARWDLANVDRIGRAVLERIGKVLSS